LTRIVARLAPWQGRSIIAKLLLDAFVSLDGWAEKAPVSVGSGGRDQQKAHEIAFVMP
jgi:hypothetical protein